MAAAPRNSDLRFQETPETGNAFWRVIRSYRLIMPCVVGLALSRTGVIVSSYGSYAGTDAGMLTDLGTLVDIAVMGIILVIIMVRKITLGKTFVRRIGIVCVCVEALSLFLLAALGLSGSQSVVWNLVFSTCSAIAVTGAIYYWLRKARGSSSLTAVFFVFASVFLSEILIYPFTFLPTEIGYLVAGALTLAQLLCMRWARSRMRRFTVESPTSTHDYFGFAKTMDSNARFLVVTAVGIVCLSLISGLLRGFPDGDPIVFTPSTRILYVLLALAICAAIIVLVAEGHRRVMTTGIWVIMQSAAYLALLAYALFPTELQYGAVFATVLNVVILAFSWYVMIAFMSYGWRDPLFYALGGWIVWLGGRSLGRIVLLNLHPVASNSMFIIALTCGMLLISAQVIFLEFVNITRKEQAGADLRKKDGKPGAMERLMGLDDSKGFTGLRQAAMEQSAQEVGKQFLLSERETEVLALYALGFTQKRVAEELYITTGTVHGHIKRIYLKTGLHSRQQILDYMEKYTT